MVGPTLRRYKHLLLLLRYTMQVTVVALNLSIFTVATVYLMMLPVAQAIFVGWWDYSLIINWREF